MSQKSLAFNILFAFVLLKHNLTIKCTETNAQTLKELCKIIDGNLVKIDVMQKRVQNKNTAFYNNSSLRSRKMDVLIYNTLRKFSIERTFLFENLSNSKYNMMCKIAKNLVTNIGKDADNTTRTYKEIINEDKEFFTDLFVDYMLTQYSRIKTGYNETIQVSKNHIQRFLNYDEYEDLHKNTYFEVKGDVKYKHKWDVHKIMGLLARFFNNTDHFLQMMRDVQSFTINKHIDYEILLWLYADTLTKMLETFEVITSWFMAVTEQYRNLQIYNLELQNFILFNMDNDNGDIKLIFTPEKCRAVFDLYLVYARNIFKFYNISDPENFFIYPPFFYEYDVRWNIFNRVDGTGFFLLGNYSTNTYDVTNYKKYKSELLSLIKKNMINFENIVEFEHSVRDLFESMFVYNTAFSKTCVLILFHAIYNMK